MKQNIMESPGQPPVIDAILMIDDEPEIVTLIQIFLGEIGLTVYGASDGSEALRFVRERGMPRLFLLDLQMPVMDGPTFVAALRSEFSHPAPILVLSAAMDVKALSLRLGASQFLSKPFHTEELKAAVLGILQGQRR